MFDLQSARGEHHANDLAGLHCALVDGSVRFISSTIDLSILHGLLTLDGGEPVGEF